MRGEITAEQIKNDKKVFGNLIQDITKDPERGEDRAKVSGVGYNVLKGEAADQFINSLVQEIANLLARKSRQINANRLSSPNGADYVNSIVNEQHQKPSTDRSLGYSGVLSTDVIRHNGSLFHGIGLSFDISSAKVGGKKITTQSAPIAAPVATSNSAQEIFDLEAAKRAGFKVQEETVSLSDMLGGTPAPSTPTPSPAPKVEEGEELEDGMELNPEEAILEEEGPTPEEVQAGLSSNPSP